MVWPTTMSELYLPVEAKLLDRSPDILIVKSLLMLLNLKVAAFLDDKVL